MGPSLPLWLLIPPAAILMLVLAGYIQALQDADIPDSRRRIRTAASLVMMVLQPLLIYLFGIGGSHQPRPFVFTWALVMALLGLLVILAMLDAINNARISAASRSELRQELRALRSEISKLNESRSAEPTTLRLADDADTEREGTHDA